MDLNINKSTDFLAIHGNSAIILSSFDCIATGKVHFITLPFHIGLYTCIHDYKKKQIFLESQRMFSFPIKECGALFHARGTEGERIEVKNQRTWNKGSNDSVVNDVEARIDGKISRKSSTLPACASSVFWLYWLFNILISGLFKAFQALFRRISGYFPEVSNTGCKSFILLELGCAWGKTK